MSNKRVSELVEIVWPEVNPSEDLFLVTDTSEQESKKMKIGALATYMQSLFSNGTVLTASYALTSGTSSVSIYSNSSSYSISSSQSSTSSYSQFCLTASYALNGGSGANHVTLADSASYLIYSGIPNGTASFSITSSYTTISQTSSYLRYVIGRDNGTSFRSITSSYSDKSNFLIYTPGVSNGTSSYSITSSFSQKASASLSSSYLIYSGISNGTSSYSITSSNSNTASYLLYQGFPNGTASYALNSKTSSYAQTASVCSGTSSYALVAGSQAFSYNTFGPYTATVTNDTTASIGVININPTDQIEKETIIDVQGDVYIPITDSDADSYIRLNLQRVVGTPFEVDLDKTSVVMVVSGATGFLKQGFNLSGYGNLSGSYSASVFAELGPTFTTLKRNVLFFVRTKSDSISIS